MNPSSQQQQVTPFTRAPFGTGGRGRGRGSSNFHANRSFGQGNYLNSKGSFSGGQQNYPRYPPKTPSMVFQANQFQPVPTSMTAPISMSSSNQTPFTLTASQVYEENLSNSLLPSPMVDNQTLSQARNNWAGSISTTNGLHSPSDQAPIDISVPNDTCTGIAFNQQLQQFPPLCTTYYPFHPSYMANAPGGYYIAHNSYYPPNGYGMLPASPPAFIPTSYGGPATYATPSPPTMCAPQPIINQPQQFLCSRCKTAVGQVELADAGTMTEPNATE